MTRPDFTTQVGLYGGPKTTTERAMRKWQPLIEHLPVLGAEPYLLNHGNSTVDEEGYMSNAQPLVGDNSATVRRVVIGALRDFTARREEDSVPSLNSQAIIAFAGDKSIFYPHFEEYSARTLVADAAETDAIEDFLHDLPGSDAVLKPLKGHNAQGVVVGSKDTIVAEVTKQSGDERFLIQELLDTSAKPPSLKPHSEIDRAKLGQATASYELRLFVSNDQFVPVLRQSSEPHMSGESFYTYIDPESVPAAALDLGSIVVGELLEATKQTEVHGALDLVYGAEHEEWKIMEMNVKEPGMPKLSDNQDIATKISHNLATQLVRMASSKNGELPS